MDKSMILVERSGRLVTAYSAEKHFGIPFDAAVDDVWIAAPFGARTYADDAGVDGLPHEKTTLVGRFSVADSFLREVLSHYRPHVMCSEIGPHTPYVFRELICVNEFSWSHRLATFFPDGVPVYRADGGEVHHTSPRHKSHPNAPVAGDWRRAGKKFAPYEGAVIVGVAHSARESWDVAVASAKAMLGRE